VPSLGAAVRTETLTLPVGDSCCRSAALKSSVIPRPPLGPMRRSAPRAGAFLCEDERRALGRLAVLEPSFSLATAATLTSLVDKSLVQAVASGDRFGLHKTIRAYFPRRSRGRGRACRHPGAPRRLIFFALAKTIEPSVYAEELPRRCEPSRPTGTTIGPQVSRQRQVGG
jgi:hypothetical protein